MAPIGNQNNKKLKTKEQKEEIFNAYCEHLALGYPKACFHYKIDGKNITIETLDKYIRTDPDFDPTQFKAAHAEGYKKWVGICMEMALGNAKVKRNVVALQIFMRNVFGWDKPEKKDAKDTTANEEIIAKLLVLIAKKESERIIEITGQPKEEPKLELENKG